MAKSGGGRTAAQKAASRRNLALARKKRGSGGRTMRLGQSALRRSAIAREKNFSAASEARAAKEQVAATAKSGGAVHQKALANLKGAMAKSNAASSFYGQRLAREGARRDKARGFKKNRDYS